jgi:hypothetical protein
MSGSLNLKITLGNPKSFFVYLLSTKIKIHEKKLTSYGGACCFWLVQKK